jgi:hypothetical protein
MAKKTSKDAVGTSFYNVTVSATINQLTEILGAPTYDTPSGDNKVQKEWVCETEDCKIFTIYDWKHYRTLSPDEVIEWHIGAKDFYTSATGADEISEMLKY